MLVIDGGYVLGSGDRGLRHGFALRPVLTLGPVALHTRLEHLFGQQPETLAELGVLLKFPVPISTSPSHSWSRLAYPRPGPETARHGMEL